MIDLLKFKEFISVIPLLIIYILPGYVFISIKDFIINKKKSEDKNFVLKCIVISYIIINFEILILDCFKISVNISSPKNIVCTFCFSILVGYLYSILSQSEFSNKLLKRFKITRSLKTDIVTDIVDFELGMWVRVFLSSEQVIYIGQLRNFEKVSDNNYDIVLSNFILCGYSGEVFIDNQKDNKEWVFINVKDNYRIELVYDPRSRKIIN